MRGRRTFWWSVVMAVSALAASAHAEAARDVRVWYQAITDDHSVTGEVAPTTFVVGVPHDLAHDSGESVFLITYNYDVFEGLAAGGVDMRFVLDGAQVCRWVFNIDALEDEHIAGEVRCAAPTFLAGAHTVEVFNDGTPDASLQGQTSILLMQVESVVVGGSVHAQAAAVTPAAAAGGALAVIALAVGSVLVARRLGAAQA